MMKLRMISLAVAAMSATPALAQDPPASPPPPSAEELSSRDSFTIGVGAGMTADYEGSDDYRFIPAAAIRGQYKGISFSTRGLYLYVDVIPDSSAKVQFNAGPIVGVRLNRTRKIKDDIVDLLPEKKTAIEGGGFAGVTFTGVTNPYGTLSARVDMLHDFNDAHNSTLFSPNIDFSTPLSMSTYVSASAGLDFVSNRYADYYFAISPGESLLTGLPVYDPKGGMKDWKVGLLVNQSLSGNLLQGLSLFGTAQYSRLLGDFKDSPIVADRGSANQWLFAAGLGYSW